MIGVYADVEENGKTEKTLLGMFSAPAMATLFVDALMEMDRNAKTSGKITIEHNFGESEG